MKNSNECEDNNEEIKLDYFKKWGDRSQKTERIYIRVFPDTKERILTACKRVDLNLSCFVTAAALEAADFIIDGDN
ncbi:MAG TPA: hypothetical protein EYN97_02155 [Candidatus Lambdaproteobacteria bacterium]|jgi:uncharacterized protein (DUF1778 family)|nr:hypothetical protein [Candidatus Lambdaproteobacteria bacterium]